MTKHPHWHVNKAASNYDKHGVTFDEAREALDDPLAKSHPDDQHSHGEDRRVAIGCTTFGRILAVCYTIRNDDVWIISARNARSAERRRYMKDKDIIRDAPYVADVAVDDDDVPDYGDREGWEPLGFVTARPVCAVTLEPDVYNSFRNSDEVNAALRELIAEGRVPPRPEAPQAALPKRLRRQ